MYKTSAAVTLAALIASPAIADGITYAELGYTLNNTSIEDGPFSGDFDLRDYRLNGAIDYAIGQWVLSAEIDSLTTSSYFSGFSLRSHQFSAAYRAAPGALIGFGLGDTNTLGPVGYFQPMPEPVLTYEIFGQYRTDMFGAAINHKIYDVDENYGPEEWAVTTIAAEVTFAGAELGVIALQEAEYDQLVYQISGGYSQGPVAARLAVTSFDELDEKFLSLSGQYEFGESYRALLNYWTLMDAEYVEMDSVEIGAGYKFGNIVWLDAGIGQETYDYEFSDSEEFNTFFIELNFETGSQERLDRKLQRGLDEDLLNSFMMYGPI